MVMTQLVFRITKDRVRYFTGAVHMNGDHAICGSQPVNDLNRSSLVEYPAEVETFAQNNPTFTCAMTFHQSNFYLHYKRISSPRMPFRVRVRVTRVT